MKKYLNIMFIILLTLATVVVIIQIVYLIGNLLESADKKSWDPLAFVGAVIGGALTLIGVRLSISAQNRKDQEEHNNCKRLALIQLKSTYELATLVPKGAVIPNFQNILFDRQWTKNIVHIDGLTDEEFKVIAVWFNNMEKLEYYAREEKAVMSLLINDLTRDYLPTVKMILDKNNIVIVTH